MEWGPATPPLTGQGPGLALTQVYSHFPRPELSALSMNIWTLEGHHEDEGKESGHMEPGLPSCSSSVGPLEAAGLEGGPGVHTVPHSRDLFYEGVTALGSTEHEVLLIRRKAVISLP